MDVASPTVGDNIFNVNHCYVCVLYEQSATSAFPIVMPTYPLFFTHNTTTFKFATKTQSPRPNILNIHKYREDLEYEYILWEVEKIESRTIDISQIPSVTPSIVKSFQNKISKATNISTSDCDTKEAYCFSLSLIHI